MIFGRGNQQGATDAQAAGTQMPAGNNTVNPWQTAGGTPLQGGYPTQPAGTGYAGYNPAQGNSYAYGSSQGNMNGAYGQSTYQTNYSGYGQATGGYTGAQGMNYTSGTVQGYGAAGYNQSGYNQTGYNQTGYNQNAYNAAGYNQTGYAQGGYNQTGYNQNAYNPAGYNQNAYAQGGNPYGAGQTAGGFNMPQGGYSQTGYNNAYAQMGRNQQAPQSTQGQIPLNGGGYVPPPTQVKRQPFQFKPWMLIAIGALLLVMFVLGMVLGSAALKWIFIAVAIGSIAFFWVKPLVEENHRLCYSIVFGLLSLVALLSATGVMAARTDSTTTDTTTAVVAASSGTSSSGSSTVVDPETGESISALADVETTEEPTATPADDSATTDRVELFFRYWASNMQDEMLTLCAPSWQSSVENAKTALFGILANRIPLDCTIEKVTGTSEDSSRTVTVTSTIDRNNGKDPVKYRLSVLMLKEGGEWYVDPQSLKTYESTETTAAVEETATPTPANEVDANTVLYYNPDGGTKYHLDQNCKSTHEKYLPLKGHFLYSQINDDEYKDLSRCNVCGAPLRPQ